MSRAGGNQFATIGTLRAWRRDEPSRRQVFSRTRMAATRRPTREINPADAADQETRARTTASHAVRAPGSDGDRFVEFDSTSLVTPPTDGVTR